MERCVRAFGLYRSGTTWMQALIDANLIGVQPLPVGCTAYKHSMYPSQMHRIPDDFHLVIIYKTLLKWVDSLCRTSYDLIDEFDLTYHRGDTPIEIAYKDENHLEQQPVMIGVSLERLIELYHQHWDYWHKQDRSITFISHHKAVCNPQKFVEQISNNCGLAKRSTFISVDKVENSLPFIYTGEQHVTELNSVQIDVINRLQRPEIQEFLIGDY